MRVYTAELRPGGLQGARIGVARNLAGFHPGVDAVFERSLATLAAAGPVLVDPANLEADTPALTAVSGARITERKYQHFWHRNQGNP